jgi:hypothetical protein
MAKRWRSGDQKVQLRSDRPQAHFLSDSALQRCFLVAALRDEALEHFDFVINSAPEVVFHAVDLHENLVEMPPTMPEIPHRLDPAPPDLRRENRPKAVPPEPHRLMRNVDPALVQQVLDVPERQRVAHIHHDRQADDLGAGLEIPKNAGVAHPVRLAALPFSGKPIFL